MFNLPGGVYLVLQVVMLVFSIFIFIHLAYYTVLALFGLKKPQRTYSIK